MRTLVDRLCSRECGGRRSGTPEGDAARAIVVSALRDAGLDPYEQAIPSGGANVLAKIAGDVNRFVLVAARFDHLGGRGENTYWGADDNAAAVAILVQVAHDLVRERDGRGVLVAAFDAEEPPFFATSAMGSQLFVRESRDIVDFMVCMDLVGHRLGGEGLPREVGESLFALGAERSADTLALVSSMKRDEAGVIVRPADAEIIPPLSDYEPFWRNEVPFLFLTAGRSRVYHTPEDTPEKLCWPKIEATARWLTNFIRRTRSRPPTRFKPTGRADRTTLDEIAEIVESLATSSREAAMALASVRQLRDACAADGSLPAERRAELAALVGAIESRLG